MKIFYRKSFLKAEKKLSPKIRGKIKIVLKEFQKNPFSPILKNHVLKGEMQGLRSLSVTGDVRIIFEEKENHLVVILVTVGTHNQVY